MRMYKYIFILTFSFAFLDSNWPFSWYILSKWKKEVSKSFQKSLLSLHFPSNSIVILWVFGVLFRSQGDTPYSALLFLHWLSVVFILTLVNIFLDIQQIRRWDWTNFCFSFALCIIHFWHSVAKLRKAEGSSIKFDVNEYSDSSKRILSTLVFSHVLKNSRHDFLSTKYSLPITIYL